jgi:hypothetical protein
VYLHSFLILALDGGEWSISCPGHITCVGRKGPYTHQMGGWVGPRAGVNGFEKGNSLGLTGICTPDVQPIASHYTDYAIPPFPL